MVGELLASEAKFTKALYKYAAQRCEIESFSAALLREPFSATPRIYLICWIVINSQIFLCLKLPPKNTNVLHPVFGSFKNFLVESLHCDGVDVLNQLDSTRVADIRCVHHDTVLEWPCDVQEIAL